MIVTLTVVSSKLKSLLTVNPLSSYLILIVVNAELQSFLPIPVWLVFCTNVSFLYISYLLVIVSVVCSVLYTWLPLSLLYYTPIQLFIIVPSDEPSSLCSEEKIFVSVTVFSYQLSFFL